MVSGRFGSGSQPQRCRPGLSLEGTDKDSLKTAAIAYLQARLEECVEGLRLKRNVIEDGQRGEQSGSNTGWAQQLSPYVLEEEVLGELYDALVSGGSSLECLIAERLRQLNVQAAMAAAGDRKAIYDEGFWNNEQRWQVLHSILRGWWGWMRGS